MEAASHATVEAALKARQVKSMLSPVVSIVVAFCTAIVLWRGTSLIVAGTMTAGALTVYLAYLTKFFKPVQGPREHDQRDRADDGRAGAHPKDTRRRRHHSRAHGRDRSRPRQGRDHFRARRVRLWR